ncbi:MAG: DMT family transporter [Thermodesulfobacteriota bacterium]
MTDRSSEARRRRYSLHLLMLLCASLVAGSFTVGEAIADSLDPALITLIRFFCSTLLLAPWIIYRYGLSISLPSLGRYSLISASLVIFFWSMFASLRYTTALNTSALFTLVPLISFLYARILVGEQLTGRRLWALILGVAGPLWIIFDGSPQRLFSLDWNHGDLLFLFGCLFMGLYPPLIRLLHRGEDMLEMTFWILFTGTLLLLIPSLGSLAEVNWSSVPVRTWLGIGYLSIFSTLISFFLTQFSVIRLGPTRVMAYSYLYPTLVLLINLGLGKSWPGVFVLPGLLVTLVVMVVIQGEDRNRT